MRRWCWDPSQGVYKKLVIRDNKVKGAVLYGDDTMDGTWYFTLLRRGTDISAFRSTILSVSTTSATQVTVTPLPA